MITKDQLNKLIKEKEELVNECNSLINKVSLIRLFVFLALGLLTITCIVYCEVVVLLLALLSLVLFIVIISYHDKKYQELSFYQNYIQVLKEYRCRHNYDWKLFKDKGEISDSALSSDLDLVGDNSLYQYLNVCKTSGAKEKLIHSLVYGLEDTQKINETRNSVKDYANYFVQNIEFQAHLKEFDKKIYRIKKNAISFPKGAKKSLLTFVLGLIISSCLLASVILSILKIINPTFIMLFIFLQLALSFLGKDKEIL